MVVDTVLLCHTKKSKKTSQGHIWQLRYPKERADLKMIHDENDVLKDDELAFVKTWVLAYKK